MLNKDYLCDIHPEIMISNISSSTPPCSSEDEVDVLLHGTPDQKRKLIRECLTGESESSSDDEFQKEMEAELSCTMKNMEGQWKSQLPGKHFSRI